MHYEKSLSPVTHHINMLNQSRQWSPALGTHLGVSFGFAAAAVAVAAAVVVVEAGTGIFVNTVQKPEEELQGVVLRVSTKLRAVFGHYALRRGEKS